MPLWDLSKEGKFVRLFNSQAAGVTTLTSSVFSLQGTAAPGSYTNWPAGGTVAASSVPGGFDAITIVIALNTVVATGVLTINLQDNSLNQAGGMANVTAVSASINTPLSGTNETVTQQGSNVGLVFTDIGGLSSNGLIVMDVVLTQLQFYQLVIARSVANSTIDSVVGVLYRSKQRPVVQDPTVQTTAFFVAGS